MLKRWAMTVLTTSCLAIHPAVRANDEAEGKSPDFSLGWLLFGDIQYVPSNHLPEGDGSMGVVIRRGYLTLDADFSDRLFGRARLELNQSGAFETYDYEVEFKDFYLGWKIGRHELVAGLSPSLTFDVIEAFWGMRYLMRTPMDLQGEASRDTGVSLKGLLNSDKGLSYRVMYADGRDFGAESGDKNKWMAALNWKASANWMIDLYWDSEQLPGLSDITTLQVFAGYQDEDQRWGFQYSNQDRQSNDPLELASVFMVRKLSDESNLVVRIDRIIEPSPRGNNISYIPFDPNAPATMLLAGLEYELSPRVRFTPNTIFIRYDRDEGGNRARDDLYLRFTLFFNFE